METYLYKVFNTEGAMEEGTIGATWIPEIRNESFDRVSPIIYFQEQPTAV